MAKSKYWEYLLNKGGPQDESQPRNASSSYKRPKQMVQQSSSVNKGQNGLTEVYKRALERIRGGQNAI